MTDTPYKDYLQPETNEGKLDYLLRSGAARSLFEKWISRPPYERETKRWPQDETKHAWPGQYKDIAVQLAWEAWQQAQNEKGQRSVQPDGSAILQRRIPLCVVGTYRDWHDCQHEDMDARIKTECDMVVWCNTETDDWVQYRVIRRTETVTHSPNSVDKAIRRSPASGGSDAGVESETTTTCERCNGNGWYPVQVGYGIGVEQEQCEACCGTGRVEKSKPQPNSVDNAK